MPGSLANSLLPADTITLALAGALVIILGVIGFRAWKKSRVTPEERERRRRSMIAAKGKLGDASIVEVRDDLLFYSYSVRGVQYTASQDVSALRQFMPADLSVAIVPMYVKYDPRNPANSIILSEEWSGFSARTATTN